MTTNILDRKRLSYIPYIGFTSTTKLIAFLALLGTLSIIALYPQTIVTSVQASTDTLSPQDTLRNRMVAYMLSKNENLPKDMAYTLADAMILQQYKYQIPLHIQLGLVAVESGFDQYAISNVGALGFYQVLPKYHILKINTMVKGGEIRTKNLYDPLTNASVGMRIFHDCIQRHHSIPVALSCYNGAGNQPSPYSTKVLQASRVAKSWISDDTTRTTAWTRKQINKALDKRVAVL